MAEVVIDFAALVRLADPLSNPELAAAMDRVAAVIQQRQKVLCPVSPVIQAYAQPGPVPGGARFAGDLPLRPSGYLRNSITRELDPADGSVKIGPTADYGVYVNDGTPPHLIHSHGPWSLRSRATGQFFGRLVHHPGTRAVRFVERSVEGLHGLTVH